MADIRSPVFHEKFQQRMDVLRDEFPRIDEVMRGIAWELARDPEIGINDLRYDVWWVRHVGTIALPPATIWYSFNDRLLLMLTFEMTESGLHELN